MTRKSDIHSVPSAPPALSRRTMFAGAGTVGALAAVTAVLPGARPEPTVTAAGAPETEEGYRLTEHVKRYYQTARV